MKTGSHRPIEAVYGRLVDNLRAQSGDVVQVQDFIATPPLREVMTSKRQQVAGICRSSIAGALATPAANESTERAIEIVKDTAAGSALTANAHRACGNRRRPHDVRRARRPCGRNGHRTHGVDDPVTGLSDPLTMLLPLATIGLSLVIAQQIIAGLAQLV